MNTREKLKEQKKSLMMPFSSMFGLGLGIGAVLGFGSHKVCGGEFGPNWFYFIIAYVLGGLTVLLYWHITDLRRKAEAES